MLELRTAPPAATIIKFVKMLEAEKQRPLTIVEVGAMNSLGFDALMADGHSTAYLSIFMQTEAKYDHKFYSIDSSVAMAKAYIEQRGVAPFVNFLEGDWKEVLRKMDIEKRATFDFVYLDAGIFPNDAMDEYREFEGRMESGGIILIDDIDPNMQASPKGDILLPYLREQNAPVIVENGMVAVKVNNG